MKYILILLGMLCMAEFVFPTEPVPILEKCDTVYSSFDSTVVGPSYLNGTDSFIRLNERLARPVPIRNGSVPAKARVYMEFGIDKQGKIFAPVVKKIARIYYDREMDERHMEYDEEWSKRIDLDYCKEEALRILDQVQFVPARRKDVNVCFEKMRTLIAVYYAAPGYD